MRRKKKIRIVLDGLCSETSIVVAATYLLNNFKDKNIAIIHDRTTYGDGLANATKAALNARGVREKLFDSYNRAEQDFSQIVSKLKSQAIDILYIGGYHKQIASILRLMRDQGLKTQIMAGDTLADQEFGSLAGPSVDGVLFTFGPDPRKNPAAASLIARFRAKGIDPEGYTLYAYAALQIWAAAVGNAGTVDSKKVADALREGAWDSALGPISFKQNGDVAFKQSAIPFKQQGENRETNWTIYRWGKNGTYDSL